MIQSPCGVQVKTLCMCCAYLNYESDLDVAISDLRGGKRTVRVDGMKCDESEDGGKILSGMFGCGYA